MIVRNGRIDRDSLYADCSRQLLPQSKTLRLTHSREHPVWIKHEGPIHQDRANMSNPGCVSVWCDF